MRLQDKVVLVTAAARGIGFACVEACAREGAIVYMAVRNIERGQLAAGSLVSDGLRVRCVYHDATVRDSFSSMLEDIIAQEGRIDVLVNNFGVSDPGTDRDLAHTPTDIFLDTVRANLISVFLTGQLAARHMAQQGGGSIINISSIGGAVPDISQIAYGTSKAAINHLTRLIAVQEAAHGVRCNAVLPGMTATDAVESRLSGEFKERFLRHVPLGRMAKPEEIAAAVVYFASDESAYTTGQLLTVAGGFGLASPLYADLAGRSENRGG